MGIGEQTVSLKLRPELGKDFKLIVDSFFSGNYDEALRAAVAILVKKEKFLCHNLEGKNHTRFVKLVDKIFQGNEDRAIREALTLLLDKYKASDNE